MKRLLITGASGFLGWNLIQLSKLDWTVLGTYFTHPVVIPGATLIQVDLTNFNEMKHLFAVSTPDAVIHTAAISAPNFCQENRSFTYKINTEASTNIAGLCSDREIPCLFTSSDLVFNGLNPPYNEDDKPSPVSVYGEQKILAEKGMKERYAETVICRMPLMFGDPGPAAESYIQSMIQALRLGHDVNLFIDEFRTPVSGRDAAKGLILALKYLPSFIHLGGKERLSRYNFGRLLVDIFGFQNARLIECKQKDVSMPARRPPDVSLDSSRARSWGFHPNSLTKELKYLQGIWEDHTH